MGTFQFKGRMKASGKFHVFFNHDRSGQILGTISNGRLVAKFDNDAISGPTDGGPLRLNFVTD